VVTDESNETPRTLRALMERGAAERNALEAPGGTPLTFAALRALMAETLTSLNGHGIGRGDRIALVLANGPEMATSFIALAAGAVAAPLNPSYTAEEFEFYLSDLKAKVLVIGHGRDSSSVEVAGKLGVPVLRLKTNPERGAGHFSLVYPEDTPKTAAAQQGFSGPDDVALVLHTSGTTSRPKLVPLRQRNICACACSIARTLNFTDADRGLNIMPLFHIHGLVGSILAPLGAGGCVSCTPGFNALKFFGWMNEVKPTWYTAVPTMHQAILARASRNKEIIDAVPLRFVRSSSSSIPPQIIQQIEEAFDCPLIESYGMTEASHQMTSNPLPPGKRKPGSVGLPAGPEVAIVDESGRRLGAGEMGEVAIRGENVMIGYDNNDEANAVSFTAEGYFRTGDQGTIDEEGYLTITGRIKEIIIRGGEKISPREVDEVLMDHPCVAQCVTFAIPHPKLGEEVAVAVVLHEAGSADERAIKDFCSSRLAAFKVPESVVFLEEIPKGATGKLQRIGLAAKLGLG
jgi:acyl-CoA synthetase (AMP-forming)/AMP-acid ligase II